MSAKLGTANNEWEMERLETGGVKKRGGDGAKGRWKSDGGRRKGSMVKSKKVRSN